VTLTTFVSSVGYQDLEDCRRIVRLLRDVFEPATCLTPDYDADTRTWRIRYTVRPEVSRG
jgi:hypothetical protein